MFGLSGVEPSGLKKNELLRLMVQQWVEGLAHF